MLRNFRTLGLALVAVFAFSAIGASAASATTPVFTAHEYPAFLDGTDTEGLGQPPNAFTAFGGQTRCPESHYGATLNGASSTLTVAPDYTNCKSNELTATVTMNGCDYLFHLKSYDGKDDGTGTVDLVCPAEKEVTVDIYHPTDTNHTLLVCQLHIPPQAGLGGGPEEGPTFTIETKSGTETQTQSLKIEGTINNITATRTGVGCEPAETKEAVYHINVTITGTNELEEHNGLGMATLP